MKISCEINGQKSWSSWSNPELFVGQFEINEIITLKNNRELVGPAEPELNAPWAKQPAPLTGSRLAEPLAARTTRRVSRASIRPRPAATGPAAVSGPPATNPSDSQPTPEPIEGLT